MQLLSSSISHILRVWGEGAHPDDGIPNMRLLPPPHPLRRPPVKLYSQSRLAMLPPPRTPRPKKPAKKPTHTQKKSQLLRRNPHGCSCWGAGSVSASPAPLSGPITLLNRWELAPKVLGWVLAERGFGELQNSSLCSGDSSPTMCSVPSCHCWVWGDPGGENS